MATEQQVRKVSFPIYGNLCLIHTLKGLGVEVVTKMEKNQAIAIFNCNDLQIFKTYECLKKILTRRYSGVSTTA